MSSTYSTNLGIELIGTGDQAGAWGITTNSNLGTLIEQAISGYVTQTVSDDPASPTTLTIPNGATGVARNMTIEFTGTLTAARNVIVPSNKKLYFIYNNTTGGYAVTVKVAGQTGVSVSNGSKTILVSNGTDVVLATGAGITGFTTGSNTAIGTSALGSLTSGGSSTAVGYQALSAMTTGNWNTGVGYWALKSATGSGNTAIGYSALYQNTSGTFNVGIGDTANSGNTTYSYTACFGASSQVTGGYQNQLGSSTTTTYAYGAVQDRSDARDKTDIQDTDLGLNFVMALRPVKFKWDMRDDYRPNPPSPDAPEAEWEAYRHACDLGNITHDGTHTRNRYHQGLIAQEVKATMDAMGVDFGGYQDHSIKGGQDVQSIGYNEMIAPLIKAIQELKAEFDEYKRTHP